MPANYARTDVRFSENTSAKLNRLQREIYEKTGKKISKSRLVEQIVTDFFLKSEMSQLAIQ